MTRDLSTHPHFSKLITALKTLHREESDAISIGKGSYSGDDDEDNQESDVSLITADGVEESTGSYEKESAWERVLRICFDTLPERGKRSRAGVSVGRKGSDNENSGASQYEYNSSINQLIGFDPDSPPAIFTAGLKPLRLTGGPGLPRAKGEIFEVRNHATGRLLCELSRDVDSMD